MPAMLEPCDCNGNAPNCVMCGGSGVVAAGPKQPPQPESESS